jgi:hypothetical protein
MNAAGVQRLESYFRTISEALGNDSRRGSFALYAMGLLGEAERKSVEPLAARACPDPEKIEALHQRLLHFVVDSKWSDLEVRRQAAQYALEPMTEREPVEAWIVDDTGFLKQGQHSVGVCCWSSKSAGIWSSARFSAHILWVPTTAPLWIGRRDASGSRQRRPCGPWKPFPGARRAGQGRRQPARIASKPLTRLSTPGPTSEQRACRTATDDQISALRNDRQQGCRTGCDFAALHPASSAQVDSMSVRGLGGRRLQQ